MGRFRSPLGVVETTKEGTDVTVVSYGSTWKIVTAAADLLTNAGINIEVIDTQTLVPFDLNHDILESVKKTNRLLVVDEDVPGGASAYILQKIIEEQNAYNYLDSPPVTITSQDHRPAYGDDGDYFSKSNIDNVIDKCYALMHESNPTQYPRIF